MRALRLSKNCSSSIPKSHQPLVRHGELRPYTFVKPRKQLFAVSGGQEQPEQPTDAQQQLAAAAAAAAGAAAASQSQPAVVQGREQLTAAAAVEHAGSSSQTEQRSDGSHAFVTTLYLALGGGLAAAGLLVATFAAPIAATCLHLGSLPLQQAAALVGCGGASLLRAGSLAAFVAGGAAAGELGTWRYQRINLGLAAAAAVTVLLQPLSFGCASPLLLLVLAAAAAATAAACGASFLQQWRGQGVRFASALGYLGPGGAVRALWVYLLRDATTLAGSLMLLLSLLAAGAGFTALTSSAAVSAVPWAAVVGGAAEPGLQYMRKVLGVGLLLAALQCWALAEFAGSTRKVSPETAVKLVLVMADEAREVKSGQLPAPPHVSPRRFDLLNVGFFAAAVVQAGWLVHAGTAGGAGSVLDVNGGDPVWRLLYWSVLAAAGYFVSVVGSLDYTDVWRVVVGAGSYLSGWVSLLASLLYVDWNWLTEVRRR
ncbi:hypothetical protein COO60DRAFT_295905 [Scenedesmus sp. NREL 46B-D3]|nr:hypothetical protein COO60DRAFT_295905 [Scenedesmus sp. NREL 46B-D3]